MVFILSSRSRISFSAIDCCAAQGITITMMTSANREARTLCLVILCSLGFVNTLAREQFLHCSITLIDCLIRVGSCGGIGVCDRNAAEAAAGNVTWALAFRPIGVP